jgi:hypothetical protein
MLASNAGNRRGDRVKLDLEPLEVDGVGATIVRVLALELLNLAERRNDCGKGLRRAPALPYIPDNIADGPAAGDHVADLTIEAGKGGVGAGLDFIVDLKPSTSAGGHGALVGGGHAFAAEGRGWPGLLRPILQQRTVFAEHRIDLLRIVAASAEEVPAAPEGATGQLHPALEVGSNLRRSHVRRDGGFLPRALLALAQRGTEQAVPGRIVGRAELGPPIPLAWRAGAKVALGGVLNA